MGEVLRWAGLVAFAVLAFGDGIQTGGFVLALFSLVLGLAWLAAPDDHKDMADIFGERREIRKETADGQSGDEPGAA